VEPTAKLAGEAGVTAMEDNVGVDEHAAMTIVKAAINPIVRQ
jgi:hypothetical protein